MIPILSFTSFEKGGRELVKGRFWIDCGHSRYILKVKNEQQHPPPPIFVSDFHHHL